MKSIPVVEFDNQGLAINSQAGEVSHYFSDKGELPEGNFVVEDEKPVNIAGEWLLIDEKIEINNEYITYAYPNNGSTLIKLPDDYVEQDYLIDYGVDDSCPLGLDVLVREDGYNIRVVPGCDYKLDANVNNDLDGHKYTGILGMKLNDNYFIGYKNDEFKLIHL